MVIPGVIAAGEYAYRGDRFSYQGALTDELARMASILCRANTLMVNMQAEIFDSFAENCGCRPVQGWIVRGNKLTICSVGNYFAFLDSRDELLNDRLGGNTKEALY
jgi:roadblock/LC7 domain-containing protein